MITAPVIIGLCGKAGSGKSTAGQWFIREFDAVPVSFAAPLKRMAQKIYSLTDAQLYGTQAEKEAVDPRYGKSARQLLQFLGTDVCRDILGEDIWIRAALEDVDRFRKATPVGKPLIFVFEDLRFPNEARALKLRGGKIIKLVCPDRSSEADESHPSEKLVDQIDADVTITSRRSPGSVDLLSQLDKAIHLPLPQLKAVSETFEAAYRLVRTLRRNAPSLLAPDAPAP